MQRGRRRDDDCIGRPRLGLRERSERGDALVSRRSPPADRSVVPERECRADVSTPDRAEADYEQPQRRSATRDSYGSGMPAATSASPSKRSRCRSSSIHVTAKPRSRRKLSTSARAKIEKYAESAWL